MAFAFGGQRSIQLSYGCARPWRTGAEAGLSRKAGGGQTGSFRLPQTAPI